MEDTLVLEDMFQRYGGDRKKVFEEYSIHRQPDAHAMCDLAMYNYIEVRCLSHLSGELRSSVWYSPRIMTVGLGLRRYGKGWLIISQRLWPHLINLPIKIYGLYYQGFTYFHKNCLSFKMRDLVTKTSFLIRKKFDGLLHWLFPTRWVPLYTSVTFSRMRYHHCVLNKKWQDDVSTICQ